MRLPALLFGLFAAASCRADVAYDFTPVTQQIDALVPLSNMFGYATDLRSKTQGRGQYSMEPSHYIDVPKSIAESIMAGRAKKEG